MTTSITLKRIAPLFAVTASLVALPAVAPSTLHTFAPSIASADTCYVDGVEVPCAPEPGGGEPQGCGSFDCQEDHHPKPCEGHGTIAGNPHACNWDINSAPGHNAFPSTQGGKPRPRPSTQTGQVKTYTNPR